MQQFWKQVGASMEIEQVDQASIVPRANDSNPELDRMLDRARVSADLRVRKADACEIGRLIDKEAIPLPDPDVPPARRWPSP